MTKLSELLQVFQASARPGTVRKPSVLKLNFRNITVVDELKPEQKAVYSSIQELSLNHNRLQSVGHLIQFESLQRLSISNNHIRDPVEDLVQAYQGYSQLASQILEINSNAIERQT